MSTSQLICDFEDWNISNIRIRISIKILPKIILAISIRSIAEVVMIVQYLCRIHRGRGKVDDAFVADIGAIHGEGSAEAVDSIRLYFFTNMTRSRADLECNSIDPCTYGRAGDGRIRAGCDECGSLLYRPILRRDRMRGNKFTLIIDIDSGL